MFGYRYHYLEIKRKAKAIIRRVHDPIGSPAHYCGESYKVVCKPLTAIFIILSDGRLRLRHASCVDGKRETMLRFTIVPVSGSRSCQFLVVCRNYGKVPPVGWPWYCRWLGSRQHHLETSGLVLACKYVSPWHGAGIIIIAVSDALLGAELT